MTDPPGRCNQVLWTADNHRTWCPEPQDDRSPSERPRCTEHLAGNAGAEHPEEKP